MPKYPQPPRLVNGTTWLYCEIVILWNSLGDDFVWLKLSTTAVEAPLSSRGPIKHYSSRGPITLWLCVLHVHWCRDCETVPEQHWNKQGTVSQSQCTLPQCKQISFGIKNESEVQGQSSPELIGILTVLHLWPRFGNPNLNSWWVMVWTSSKWGQFWVRS